MDFDDAFANAAYIPGGDHYPARWTQDALAFRAQADCRCDLSYGPSERQRFDLFLPPAKPKGLIVFVHGGYWLRFDKSYWSHFAAGPLAQGWAVAMPSYDLCPDVHITDIGVQISNAIAEAARLVDGPIRLAGHSAGGQLVARVCTLPDLTGWQERIEKIIPISPVADLAPLMQTSMNADLGVSAQEAQTESPVNLPKPKVPVSVWVGADERPVFVAQAKQLATKWTCRSVIVKGLHHFDILDGLRDFDSELTADLCL